jgi:hypothetical protein
MALVMRTWIESVFPIFDSQMQTYLLEYILHLEFSVKR